MSSRPSVSRAGNRLYFNIKDDGRRIAEIRQMLAAESDRYTNPNAFLQIQSAVLNGQSFQGIPDMSHDHRYEVMQWAIRCVEKGGPISSLQITTF